MGRLLLGTQLAAVARHVKGQHVTDYGAGDLTLTRQLLAAGAEHIIAVDKDPIPDPGEPRLRVIRGYFDDCTASTPVAFVSWPVNRRTELHSLLEVTPVVIYVGSNLDGNACGYPLMYQQLARREVLEHYPHFRNTLIVYGPERLERPVLPEEYAGIHTDEPYRCFRDVYAEFVGGSSRGVATQPYTQTSPHEQ